ncbi:MAG: hypothetical protein WA728_21400 [Xanthobacteraceae bacterium]
MPEPQRTMPKRVEVTPKREEAMPETKNAFGSWPRLMSRRRMQTYRLAHLEPFPNK